MKGIKILVTGITSLTVLCLIAAGSAQTNKNEHAVKPKQGAKMVKLIKDCAVPYLNTKRLYAVGGQAYLVPLEVDEEKLYADDGEQYLIPLSPAVGGEQSPAEAKGREYRISREVEVKGKGKRGTRTDIQTLAAVGHIDKADIFIINDRVVKIIIIDMEQ